MAITTSMAGNLLDIRYGDRATAPQYNGSLLRAHVDDATVSQALVAGRVFSITTAGFLVPGIKLVADATGSPVPYFAFSGLDVNNAPASKRNRGAPGNFTPASPWNTGANAGNAFAGVPGSTTGLVGSFGTISFRFQGELATTAFDTTATYTPGMALTAIATTATNQALRGLIRPQNAATDPVVGFVAPAGKYTGPYGYSMLAFYPAYVAGTTVAIA